MSNTRNFVRLLLIVSTLWTTTSFAWVATRFNDLDGNPSTNPEYWNIRCNDGTYLSWIDYGNQNTGPEWTYKGCAAHGGLVVAPPEGFPPLQEFQVDIFSFIGLVDPEFPPVDVASLVQNDILSLLDAIQLTGLLDPSIWAEIFTSFTPVFGPSPSDRVSVFGQSVDISQSNVPEPSTVALIVLSLARLGFSKRKAMPEQQVGLTSVRTAA